MPKEAIRAILRDEKTDGDMRYLGVRYSSDGDLVIEGQDLGDAVEVAFGYHEYEWTWTVARSDLPKLAEALGASSSLLVAIENRFRGPAAAHLATFLKENDIPYTSWSRIGD
jgi:hypothetical protein